METSIKSVYLTSAAIALVCFAFSPAAQAETPEPAKVDKATRARVSESYGKLPLSFEANKGQQDGQVKFLSRGSGYNLFLTNREAVMVLTKPEEPAPQPAKKAAHATLSQKPKRQSIVLRTQLIGANPAGKVTGEEELQGNVNYFIGDDPAKWRTGVATYARVRYREVYPGIDLVYYGNQGQLEYDFVVRPGADPACIRLSIPAARKMYVNEQGQLVVQTARGAARWNKPGIYQQASGTRHEVKGKYVLRRGHELSFEVASYDTARPLIIDPTLVYSTYLGGSGADYGYDIAVDNSGNAYIFGRTSSSDFPTTAGTFQTTNHGGADAFVTKLNPAGTALIYSTYLGGSNTDYTSEIALDTSGNAYVTGETLSSDFPITAGAYQTTFGGVRDAYVTELNPTGSALLYSTYVGGSDVDTPHGIALDTAGNAYLSGETYSSNFPTTPGAFQTTIGSSIDAFVTELNPNGTALVYSTYLGGSGLDYGYAIAVDTSGHAYVTGNTFSSDFPTTPGAFQTTFDGRGAFVTEFNPTGTALVYSTYLGAGSTGLGIAVDSSGNAYVTGNTFSSDFPTTPGAFQTTFGGSQDAFVTELNPTGTGLFYSTYLGGGGSDEGRSIAVDTSGNAYVAGYTSSTNFPTTAEAFQTTYGGGRDDAFVTELNPTGTSLVYSTYLGGSDIDHGYGVALDASGTAYVTGDSDSDDFPTIAGSFHTTNQGSYDAFVAKIDTASQIVLNASQHRMGEVVLVRLVWTGATSSKVDIYRDGVQIARVRNIGRYRDTLTASGLYTYKVCETHTTSCSNEVTVSGP
jgi:hypothetical protein